MPTYEYKCAECQAVHEALQKISDPPLTRCPHCGKDTLKRGPGGGIGLQFKGSGFYITDYNQKSGEGCPNKDANPKAECPCANPKDD